MNKKKLLDQIVADIIDHRVCPDLAKTATNLVIGEGNLDADILFIGEAPGKKEDLEGRPFVGAAGKFLDEMLEKVNIAREDVYITNIVKYRPPNNRDPLPEEKKTFWPYLLRQIKVVNPKIVVTLGRHSMEAFLLGQKISQIHGEAKRQGDLIILPLYHPAAALYNGGMRQTLIDDFNRIPKIIELIDSERKDNK